MCSIARKLLDDALENLGNTQIISVNVLAEAEIRSQVETSSESIRVNIPTRLMRPLNLIQSMAESSQIVSALNTNYILTLVTGFPGYPPLFYTASVFWDFYINNSIVKCQCDLASCSSPAGFYNFSDSKDYKVHYHIKPYLYNASDVATGFIGSCTSLDAVLQATFVCLYDVQCLARLAFYLPAIAPVIIEFVWS